MHEVYFLIAAFFSEIIGTVAGFGSSTIFLPLGLLFLDFNNVLVLVAMLHIFGNLGRITFFKNSIDKKVLVNFGIPSVIFTFVGAMLIRYVPQNYLKLGLGIFLLFYAIVFFVHPNLKLKPNRKNSFIGGSISGFFAGLIGTGGALRGAFLTSFNLKKENYIATVALIALIVDFARIQVYFANGLLSSDFYYLIPSLFVVAFVGSYVGKKIVDRLPHELFKKLVLFIISLISLLFIYEGFTN